MDSELSGWGWLSGGPLEQPRFGFYYQDPENGVSFRLFEGSWNSPVEQLAAQAGANPAGSLSLLLQGQEVRKYGSPGADASNYSAEQARFLNDAKLTDAMLILFFPHSYAVSVGLATPPSWASPSGELTDPHFGRDPAAAGAGSARKWLSNIGLVLFAAATIWAVWWKYIR